MQPTSCPSFQSTEQPSHQSSGQPSSTSPSGNPSGCPSSVPTTVPSTNPTPAPVPTITNYPTVTPSISFSPTCVPSSTPTLSHLTLWNREVNRFDEELKSRSVKQAVYMDLIVKSERILGNCPLWTNFADDETSTNLILHKASAISLTTVADLHLDFKSCLQDCNSSNVASSIVQYFNLLAQSTLNIDETTVFDCGLENIWRVGRCEGVSVPYICVNCNTPCALSKVRGYWENTSSILWYNSSCQSGTVEVDVSSRENLFRVLVIDYEELSSAPDLVSLSAVSPAGDIIMVSVILAESSGALVCGAFASSPLSVGEIQLQNQLIDVTGFNVTYIIEDVRASSDYQVYCATYSTLNVPMTFSKMLDTKLTVRTACCRTATIEILKQSVYNFKDVSKVIRVSINSPYPENLNISLSTLYRVNESDDNVATVHSIFAPKSVYFAPDSKSYSQDIAFISSNGAAGIYTLNFHLGGESTSDFDVAYLGGSIFMVLGNGMEPSAPRLKSAQFDNNGMSVHLRFDTATNRGLFSNIFSCEDILEAIFIDSTTSCLWTSDVDLSLFSSGVGGAEINDTVTLLPDVLQAKCDGLDASNCNGWQYSSSSATRILSPAHANPPHVSIVAPASVGPCDDLVFDMTGSTGAGGRPFTTISITVDSIHPNISDLNTFLSSVNNIRDPILISSDYLQPNFAYNFVAVLCTFFGSCGRASHQLVVSKSINVPVISVNSDKIRSVYRYSTLSIRGNAHTFICGSSTTTKNLNFAWSLYTRNPSTQAISKLTDSRFQSSSADPRVLKLNPFTLDVGGVYAARLTVTHTVSLKSSTFWIDIFVITGDIVSVLSVPSRMGLRFDSSIHLDAGGSYDEDSDSDDPSENLVYFFECKLISPAYSDICDLSFQHNTNASVEVSFGNSTGDEIGNIYEVRVVVQHASDSRFSESFVEITILPSSAPKIMLTSENNLRINPSQKVKLIGNIEYSSSGYAIWDISDDSIDIDDSPLFDRTKLIAGPPGGQSVGVLIMSLVLPPFTLPPQSTFTFSLSCFLSGGNFSNVASITLTTNSPPQPGLFIIIPKNGTMLETTFSFSAAEWEDVDRPMSYDFGYQSNSGAYTVSRSRLEVSYFVTSSLPSGIANADYNLSVQLQVFDILNAKTAVVENIRVVEGQELSVDDMQALLSSGIEASNGYSDGLKELIATLLNLVNKVNCSEAPDCLSLNRESCSTISRTCGECLPGFVGDPISSNDKCQEVDENAKRNSNIEIFEECNSEGQCYIPSKRCPSTDCSGHGKCEYVSPRVPNMTFTNCTVVDFHCLAKCTCSDNYAGVACEFLSEDYIGRLDTRHEIVQLIRNISLLDDPTPESLSSWLQGLADVCSNPAGLYAHTKILISELAIEFIGIARTLLLPYEELNSVRITLDLVLSALSEGSSAPASLLDAYAAFISRDLVQGQNNVAVTASTFRVASYDLDGSTNVTCTAPQSTLQEFLKQTPQSAVVPESSTLSGYRFSLLELLVSGFDSAEYLSAPLGLRFVSSPCNYTANESCTVFVTLQHTSLEESVQGSSNATDRMLFTCTNDVENQTAICPNGETLSVSCNGTAGTVLQYCPYNSIAKRCMSIGRDESACTLVEVTPTNISCACTLPTLVQRRVLSNGAHDSEISIDFATAGTAIFHEFTATWMSVNKLTLSDVAGSWLVLLTLGLLAVVSIALLFLSWREDMIENKRLAQVAARKNDTSDDNKPNVAKLLLDGKMRRRVIQGTPPNLTDQQKNRTVHDVLDSALPSVLQPIPLWTKCTRELKQYHRWAGIYFHYSRSYSRPLRLLALLTNVILLLFVDALTYDLRDPDDGRCELEKDIDSCLSEPSSLTAGKSKCVWDDDNSSCHIRDTDNSLSQILTVAIFSSLIGTPFAVAIHVSIQKYLAAETRKPSSVHPGGHGDMKRVSFIRGKSFSRDFNGNSAEVDEASVPRRVTFLGLSEQSNSVLSIKDDLGKAIPETLTENETKEYLKDVHEEVPLFFADIRKYRHSLEGTDKSTFDRIWGISDDDIAQSQRDILKSASVQGKQFLISTLTKTKSGSSELILLSSLKNVHEETRKEMHFFDSSNVNESRKNKRLIYLFIKDLLGSANSKILEAKESRDNKQSPTVSLATKTVVWGIILLTLGGMLFYVYLFAMRQTASRQSSWFKTFIIWLLLELLLVSSAIVLVTHVFIPSFVLDELKHIREKTVAEIRAYREAFKSRLNEKKASLVESGEGIDDAKLMKELQILFAEEMMNKQEFNAAKYLFVSNRVAKEFPNLPISGSVLSYSTQWPQQSMTNEKHLSDNYNSRYNFLMQSVSRIAVFLLLSIVQFPEPVQDCIIEVVSTSGLGYCVVLLLTLYHINPFIVIVPLVFVAMSIHFIISSTRTSALLPKDKTATSKLSPDKISTIDDTKYSTLHMQPVDEQGDEMDAGRSLTSMTDEFNIETYRNIDRECREEITEFMTQQCKAYSRNNNYIEHIINSQMSSSLMTIGDNTTDGCEKNPGLECEDLESLECVSTSTGNIYNNFGESKNVDHESDEIFLQYKQTYDASDAALKRFLARIRGETPISYQNDWHENSDEFKYLYSNDIVPFTDKYGNNISSSEIVNRRLQLMKSDIDLYTKNKEAAEASIEKRQRESDAWDNYRLYDSEVILPFTDSSGHYFSEKVIKGTRHQRKVMLSMKQDKVSLDINGDQFQNFAKPLYEAKQLAEYDLMVYSEKLGRRQKVTHHSVQYTKGK